MQYIIRLKPDRDNSFEKLFVVFVIAFAYVLLIFKIFKAIDG